jgi:hypothetical protein
MTDDKAEKFEIECDEKYPFYSLMEREWGLISVDAETLARWSRVTDDWQKMQGELRALYESTKQ